ncbi:hypothetical protein MTR_7g065610 [Medicago truncatula]|uniref:Uncharacterized protein n=1 Tax=Medicago truncatula TaxID=3880 RepID=G7L6H1_MEDTR|nr:hypothetical protein MTR_7g065610 [Medicago truncatula]
MKRRNKLRRTVLMEYHNQLFKGFSPFTLPKKKERYQRSKGSSPINGLAPKNHDNIYHK